MGLGRFGGGLGATRWLAEQGAEVLVTDLSPADKLAEPLEEIRPLAERGVVKLRLGEHNVSDFTTCDLVVANPAVPKPWENRFLRAATAAGIPITTEIRLLVERLPNRARTIGITGSAGKSTTSAMVHHALARLAPPGRRVHLGGNIGVSLLQELPRIAPDDWVVLELSSFMLHWLGEGVSSGAAGWSPAIGVVTNISPNHLDWHGSMAHYEGCKLNIGRYRNSADELLCFSDLAGVPDGPGVRMLDPACPSPFELRIPGAHNQRNALLAWRILEAAGRRDASLAPDGLAALGEQARRAFRDFPGLPHRLQFVGQVRGVRFFNDSKCTTPEAALLAIRAFADDPLVGARRVHLIAGGYDKGSDLAPIARLAAELGGLYTIGKTGPAIAREAGGKAIECGTLDRAVAAAAERAGPGQVVLLSPACASWDQFTNYEFRGETFAELVRKLGIEGGA